MAAAPRLPLLAVLLLGALTASALATTTSLYDLEAVTVDGELEHLSKYGGSISLVINVASYCGLTKTNYEELVQLQAALQNRNFQVLAFPCNQFNKQEPKTNAEIKSFAAGYRANFPMFAKSTVNEPYCPSSQGIHDCMPDSKDCCPRNTHVYTFLKSFFPGDIEWNFAKFLVDGDGVPIARYLPTTGPLSIMSDIEESLRKLESGSDKRDVL